MSHSLPVLIILALLQSVCFAADVVQKPLLAMSNLEKDVSITCEHQDSSYYYKYWYRQQKGQPLVLMGYTAHTNAPEMEPEFKEKMKIQTQILEKSILTISNVTAQDSAMYYCASSTNSNQKLEFGAGTLLSVLEPGRNETPPKLSIFPPVLLEVQKNGHALIACVARDFYPEHIHMYWMVNNELRKESSQSEVLENAGTLTMSSLLRVSKEEYFNPNNNFQCRAGFRGREKENNIAINIKGEIGCGISRESYKRYVNNGKFSYLLILFKSGLYGLIVVAVVIRKKAIRGSS